MTFRDWIAEAEIGLSRQGIASARLEAELIVGAAEDLTRSQVVAQSNAELRHENRASEMLVRRLRHEPLAYILGWREFYGRRFLVNPAVLIPRHETEIVVDAALEVAREWGSKTVLDLATGSGCIAITLALEGDFDRVFATDISPAAVETAARNAKSLGAKVCFAVGDLVSPIRGRFDLVVSNPPYIGSEEPLPEEIRRFEPAHALISAPFWYSYYLAIAQSVPRCLVPGGKLVVELSDREPTFVVHLFQECGWTVLDIKKDLGARDRALVLILP